MDPILNQTFAIDGIEYEGGDDYMDFGIDFVS